MTTLQVRLPPRCRPSPPSLQAYPRERFFAFSPINSGQWAYTNCVTWKEEMICIVRESISKMDLSNSAKLRAPTKIMAPIPFLVRSVSQLLSDLVYLVWDNKPVAISPVSIDSLSILAMSRVTRWGPPLSLWPAHPHCRKSPNRSIQTGGPHQIAGPVLRPTYCTRLLPPWL